MTKYSILINNLWIEGKGKKIVSSNPAIGEKIWEGKAADKKQVDIAVKSAREAFYLWFELTFTYRCNIIKKFGSLLKNNKEKLEEVISIETGKPLWESNSEVDSMISKIDISINSYIERTGIKESNIPLAKSVTLHKPYGVIAVFAPFNFPGHLSNGHIVPALLAGNTILFKPNEFTPLVAQKTVELWQEAGLPEGVINLLQGQKETGKILAQHEGIDGIFFTGSSDTGLILHKQAAGNPQKILALEIGGNNLLIVTKMINIQAAVYHTILSAYISTGQRCTCDRRLFVPSGKEGDEFIKKLIDSVKKIKIGSYDDKKEPFMGPIISEQSADNFLKEQDNLIKSGGIPRIEMKKLKQNTGFITPDLINVTKIKNLPDKEYFGPLLQLIRYDNFKSAIHMSNNTKFGIAAAILCDDPLRYENFYKLH